MGIPAMRATVRLRLSMQQSSLLYGVRTDSMGVHRTYALKHESSASNASHSAPPDGRGGPNARHSAAIRAWVVRLRSTQVKLGSYVRRTALSVAARCATVKTLTRLHDRHVRVAR